LGNINVNQHRKIRELNQQLDHIRHQIQEAAKGVFADLIADLFKENEDLDSFGWRQWTPHWNDGAPCVFAASTDPDTIYINGSNVYDDDFDMIEVEEMSDDENRRAAELADMVSKILIAVGDSNLELMFGDHVEIVVHRNGDIEVKKYEEHD
jgi:hypothetical protein